MIAANIAMRSIYTHKAFDKSLVLREFGQQLTMRGFRLEREGTITLTREQDDPFMHVAQEDPPGRVPGFNPELQSFLAGMRQCYDALVYLLEEGDFEGRAGAIANRGVQVMGHLRDWLARQGDDRAEILGRVEGTSGADAQTGWMDSAGAQMELIKGGLLVMGGLREDIT